MASKEFKEAVRSMRASQKAYFRAEKNTPEKREYLVASRVDEAKVDRLLLEDDTQEALFPEE